MCYELEILQYLLNFTRYQSEETLKSNIDGRWALTFYIRDKPRFDRKIQYLHAQSLANVFIRQNEIITYIFSKHRNFLVQMSCKYVCDES